MGEHFASDGPEGSAERAAKVLSAHGVWNCLAAGCMLAKQAQHNLAGDQQRRLDYCLFAAELLFVPFASSLPHARRKCDYGSYEAREIYPRADLFSDEARCAP